MASSTTANERERLFDKSYYVTRIHQYLASLTSDDPLSSHTSPLRGANSKASTLGETIESPPLPDILHPQVQQVEYPNLLNPNGASSDRNSILMRAEASKAIITDSMFEVQSVLVVDPALVTLSSSEDRTSEAADTEDIYTTAAVEALWTGTVVKNINENLKKGVQLKARFAMFFEFRGGKVYRQRNYDCFDPF